jgi:hypothetical protein
MKQKDSEWIPLDPTKSDHNATHGMWIQGSLILKLKPRIAYAYSQDEEGGVVGLAETRHIQTTYVWVGHMSASTSEGWCTTDGLRKSVVRTENEIMADFRTRIDGRHQRGDRAISRKTFESWIAPEGLRVDLTPEETSVKLVSDAALKVKTVEEGPKGTKRKM